MCMLNEPAAPVTMWLRLNRQRSVGAATTAVICSGDRCAKTAKSNKSNGENESLYLHGLNKWFRNYYVAYAFVVCVKINNFTAFPFEHSKYGSSG